MTEFIDLSDKKKKVLIFNPIMAEAYNRSSDKFPEFKDRLLSQLCQSGGHKKIKYSDYTENVCKYGNGNMRGIGFVFHKYDIVIAVVSIGWHKNEDDVPKGLKNTHKSKSKNSYRKLDTFSEKQVSNYIHSAKEDNDKLVFEC